MIKMGDDIMSKNLEGKIILTKDNKAFMVEIAPKGDKALMDLSNYKVRIVGDIEDYISQFHFGILTVSNSLILSR